MDNSSSDAAVEAEAIALVKGGLIPLYTCGAALTWVLHDYLITLESEVKYMWPGKNGFGKLLFYWVRYYTIAVCLFDVAQIHSFHGFQPSLTTCVAMDAVIRLVGALLLWPIEIIMQLRIYALYECNRKVAVVNGALFSASVAVYLYVLVHNAQGRAATIASAKVLPIPGCPTINTGIEWAQWVPATIFEGIICCYALAKSGNSVIQHARASIRSRLPRSRIRVSRTSVDVSSSRRTRKHQTLIEILVQDHLVYFCCVAALLIFNNLMVVGKTRIPWFSYGPFHAALGIMTGRMLINLRRSVVHGEEGYLNTRSAKPHTRTHIWDADAEGIGTRGTDPGAYSLTVQFKHDQSPTTTTTYDESGDDVVFVRSAHRGRGAGGNGLFELTSTGTRSQLRPTATELSPIPESPSAAEGH